MAFAKMPSVLQKNFSTSTKKCLKKPESSGKNITSLPVILANRSGTGRNSALHGQMQCFSDFSINSPKIKNEVFVQHTNTYMRLVIVSNRAPMKIVKNADGK